MVTQMLGGCVPLAPEPLDSCLIPACPQSPGIEGDPVPPHRSGQQSQCRMPLGRRMLVSKEPVQGQGAAPILPQRALMCPGGRGSDHDHHQPRAVTLLVQMVERKVSPIVSAKGRTE